MWYIHNPLLKYSRQVAGMNLVVRNKPAERGANDGEKLLGVQGTQVCGILRIIGLSARFGCRCGLIVTSTNSDAYAAGGAGCLSSRFVSNLSISVNNPHGNACALDIRTTGTEEGERPERVRVRAMVRITYGF